MRFNIAFTCSASNLPCFDPKSCVTIFSILFSLHSLFLLFFFLDKKEPKNQDLLDLSGFSSQKKGTQPKLDVAKMPHLRTVRCLSPFYATFPPTILIGRSPRPEAIDFIFHFREVITLKPTALLPND